MVLAGAKREPFDREIDVGEVGEVAFSFMTGDPRFSCPEGASPMTEGP
jgi:hypothetical protein